MQSRCYWKSSLPMQLVALQCDALEPGAIEKQKRSCSRCRDGKKREGVGGRTIRSMCWLTSIIISVSHTVCFLRFSDVFRAPEAMFKVFAPASLLCRQDFNDPTRSSDTSSLVIWSSGLRLTRTASIPNAGVVRLCHSQNHRTEAALVVVALDAA